MIARVIASPTTKLPPAASCARTLFPTRVDLNAHSPSTPDHYFGALLGLRALTRSPARAGVSGPQSPLGPRNGLRQAESVAQGEVSLSRALTTSAIHLRSLSTSSIEMAARPRPDR